jgi:hypothetical protein
MLHKIIFIIPTSLFLLPLLAQMIQSNSVPNVAKEKEPLKALKMIGPEPLAPGQKGTIKTAYFDPKVSARKGKEIEEGMPKGIAIAIVNFFHQINFNYSRLTAQRIWAISTVSPLA